MIKLEKSDVVGFEHAIRGMRNPMNSWDKSDSGVDAGCIRCKNGPHPCCDTCSSNNDCEHKDKEVFTVGPNDHDLMTKLAAGGPVHAKYRRMITVYVDITAPLYWWKEFDTYKVGTVANSCSTMHKIHAKHFEVDDFSHEHLVDDDETGGIIQRGICTGLYTPGFGLEVIISILNKNRQLFLETNDKKYWWQMIQLLPSSYNQKRTVMLNYEVLTNIYESRKNHKLDEWHDFCEWIEGLPYSELITGSK